MKRILVTGGNGFVGRHLCDHLSGQGYSVRPAVRVAATGEQVAVGNIASGTNWREALTGVDAIVHLAARVHVMKDQSEEPLTEFRKVNVAGTVALATQAAAVGARRLIYVSSVKATDRQDPYGRSKLEAEQSVLEIAKETKLEVVVIRPPLVYGPGVGGNFLRLLRIVANRIPLPLAAVRNRRSLVSVYNLCDLIELCIRHPRAPGNVFDVSDGDDKSTPELLTEIGVAMKRNVLIWPMPAVLIRALFVIFGKRSDFDRLFGSLHVSLDKAQQLLGWSPLLPFEDGIQKTVDWYRDQL